MRIHENLRGVSRPRRLVAHLKKMRIVGRPQRHSAGAATDLEEVTVCGTHHVFRSAEANQGKRIDPLRAPRPAVGAQGAPFVTETQLCAPPHRGRLVIG